MRNLILITVFTSLLLVSCSTGSSSSSYFGYNNNPELKVKEKPVSNAVVANDYMAMNSSTTPQVTEVYHYYHYNPPIVRYPVPYSWDYYDNFYMSYNTYQPGWSLSFGYNNWHHNDWWWQNRYHNPYWHSPYHHGYVYYPTYYGGWYSAPRHAAPRYVGYRVSDNRVQPRVDRNFGPSRGSGDVYDMNRSGGRSYRAGSNVGTAGGTNTGGNATNSVRSGSRAPDNGRSYNPNNTRNSSTRGTRSRDNEVKSTPSNGNNGNRTVTGSQPVGSSPSVGTPTRTRGNSSSGVKPSSGNTRGSSSSGSSVSTPTRSAPSGGSSRSGSSGSSRGSSGSSSKGRGR